MPPDADAARLMMELRHLGISDEAVLRRFEHLSPSAFGLDAETFIASGALALLAAKLEGFNFSKQDHDAVMLEIGTGSGFATALFSGFVRRVYSVERDRDAFHAARQRFTQLGFDKISVKLADGSKGWPEMAPFAMISVNPALPAPPLALADQLAPQGRIIAPILAQPVREAGLAEQMLTLFHAADDGLRPRTLCSANKTAINLAPLWQNPRQ